MVIRKLSRYPVTSVDSLLPASVARKDVTVLPCVWRNNDQLRQEYQEDTIHLSDPESVELSKPEPLNTLAASQLTVVHALEYHIYRGDATLHDRKDTTPMRTGECIEDILPSTAFPTSMKGIQPHSTACL